MPTLANHAFDASSAAAHPRPFAPTQFQWRLIQGVLLAGGAILVAALLLTPAWGLAVLWNILIPVAPLLVTVAPGLWRNICPMATASLLPRRLGLSGKGFLTQRGNALLTLLGVAALLAIVPLRHLSLNTDGAMTALMLVLATSAAIWAGGTFEYRSGWCASLCPISPVEKLYGQSPAITLENARCDSCRRCTSPCPDSTKSMTPLMTGPLPLQKALGHLMVGGFAGFIWGWYQLPDYPAQVGMSEILAAYAWPFGCGLISLAAYGVAWRWLMTAKAERQLLQRIFAALAVGTYYWFRIPALTGFGPFADTGVLVDLSAVLPGWFPLVSQSVTSAFFLWFLVLRPSSNRAWMKRPPFEEASSGR